MFGFLKSINPDERFTVGLSFVTLTLIMTSHATMETARDALFLSSIPAANLPWVYLGIAGVALVINWLERYIPHHGLHWLLGAWLVLSIVVTSGFWYFLDSMGDAGLYALYIWSGTMASVVLVHFWSLMSSVMTVTDAKRVFSVIGAGAGLGAILGSGLAGLATLVVRPVDLLLLAIATLAFALVGPFILGRETSAAPEQERSKSAPSTEKSSSDSRGLVELLNDSYISRIAGLVVIGAVTVTFVDIVFKAAAAKHIDADDLARFFAITYFALNVVSLIVQVYFVTPLVRRLSVSGALTILPSILVVTSAVGLVGGGLFPAVGMKAGDGVLRHSLNRTATELLYVPMKRRVREQVKAVIDVMGQRGGQAIASLVILGGVALDASYVYFVAAIGVLSVGWGVVARSIHGPYLEVFRKVLRDSKLPYYIDYPELDVGGLETLLEALSSDDDERVLAALTLLHEEGRASTIPALILYHPSEKVVVKALEIFIESGRQDFAKVAERVSDEGNIEVRVAILAALAMTRDSLDFLERERESDVPALRATACLFLALHERENRSNFEVAFENVLDFTSKPGQIAVIRAIGMSQARAFDDALINALCDRPHGESEVREAILVAMGRIQSEAFIEPIAQVLADRHLRKQATSVLVGFGEQALVRLEELLNAPDVIPSSIRWQIPGAIAAFKSERAADILVQTLSNEDDGMVRYRCVRQLELMRLNDPKLRLDKKLLEASIDQGLRRVFSLVYWRLVAMEEAEKESRFKTNTQELLVEMLEDKARHGVDLVVRQIALRYFREGHQDIVGGLSSTNPSRRSSSLELLENRVPAALRGPVMALVQDLEASTRIEEAGDYLEQEPMAYNDLLANLLSGSSEMLRALAAHHVGELGATEFLSELKGLKETSESTIILDIVDQALDALQRSSDDVQVSRKVVE